MIDMDYRWRRAFQEPEPETTTSESTSRMKCGEPEVTLFPWRPCLEDYVAKFPDLGSLEQLPAELTDGERQIRSRWKGENDDEPRSTSNAAVGRESH
jgi:hypothetical protein